MEFFGSLKNIPNPPDKFPKIRDKQEKDFMITIENLFLEIRLKVEKWLLLWLQSKIMKEEAQVRRYSHT